MFVFPFAMQPGFDPASWARQVYAVSPELEEINGNRANQRQQEFSAGPQQPSCKITKVRP
jgi:hypothetical protein